MPMRTWKKLGLWTKSTLIHQHVWRAGSRPKYRRQVRKIIIIYIKSVKKIVGIDSHSEWVPGPLFPL